MEIFISDIPPEGLHLEGEFPSSIFDLPPGDSIRSVGPVRYSVDLYAFEEVVVASGWMRGPFQLQCGTCLEFFDYDADLSDWSSEIDLEPGQRSFNLKDLVREDFILGLPQYPRCDDFDDDRVCPKEELLAKFEDNEEVEPPGTGNPGVWGALDDLN